MLTVDEMLGRFRNVWKVKEDSWKATCPVHDDDDPSLSITPEESWLLNCFADRETEDVIAKVGLTWRDLFADNGRPRDRCEIAHYDYVDEQGEPLFRAVRFEPKDFKFQRPPVGLAEWDDGIKGIRRVLYRLPAVLRAKARAVPIYLVEGEMDVQAVERAGAVATCNPGGIGRSAAVRRHCVSRCLGETCRCRTGRSSAYRSPVARPPGAFRSPRRSRSRRGWRSSGRIPY